MASRPTNRSARQFRLTHIDEPAGGAALRQQDRHRKWLAASSADMARQAQAFANHDGAWSPARVMGGHESGSNLRLGTPAGSAV
jgi:hypothetical protein